MLHLAPDYPIIFVNLLSLLYLVRGQDYASKASEVEIQGMKLFVHPRMVQSRMQRILATIQTG